MVLLTCANRWWTHGVGWIVHNETSDTTRHVHLPTCMHAPLPLAMRWPYELVPSRPPPDRRSGKFRCTLARIGVAGGAARSTLKWGVSENRPSFAGGLTGPMPPQTLPEQHAEGTVTPDVGRTIPHPAHRGDGHTGAATHSTHGETAGPQEPAPSAKHTTHRLRAKCCLRRIPCTGCGCADAGKCWLRRIPCTGCAGADAGKCWLRRIPCTGCAGADAGKCYFRRIPCTGCGGADAGKCCLRRIPCTGRAGGHVDTTIALAGLPVSRSA
jgi:hypothetical protein